MNDLNPDARRLVNLAREGRTPGEGDKSRVAERLAVALAASAAAGTAVSVAKAAATVEAASAGAKAAGTTLLGKIGLGSMGAKIAAAALVTVVGTTVVVGQLNSKQMPAVEIAPVGPAATQPAPRLTEPTAVAPAAPAVADAPTVVEPKAAQKSNSMPSTVQSSKPSLAEEAALLHQAQSAWRAGQSAEALRLANEHAQKFPHSQLANERDVLRVLSLCKLGQVQAAKQVGTRLLQKAQGSPWYESVAESCAAK